MEVIEFLRAVPPEVLHIKSSHFQKMDKQNVGHQSLSPDLTFILILTLALILIVIMNPILILIRIVILNLIHFVNMDPEPDSPLHSNPAPGPHPRLEPDSQPHPHQCLPHPFPAHKILHQIVPDLKINQWC
ncbi:unnamed protein product, partial [Nesidiocoris tenuis]